MGSRRMNAWTTLFGVLAQRVPVESSVAFAELRVFNIQTRDASALKVRRLFSVAREKGQRPSRWWSLTALRAKQRFRALSQRACVDPL